MGKISYKIRENKKGKVGTGIGGVSIVYSHKAHLSPVPFQKATGVIVELDNFDLVHGKVVGRTDAPELNAVILRYYNDLETCLRNLDKKGVEPFKSALDAEWDNLQQLRATREVTEPQAKRVLGKILDVLKLELADLEEKVRIKKLEIEQEEIKQECYVDKLFTKHIDLFLAENTTLKKNSKDNYLSLQKVVEQWKPELNITHINKSLLNNFREYLTTHKATRVIDQKAMNDAKEADSTFDGIIYVRGLRNSSARELLQKMKIVYYFFADKFGYDITVVKKWKSGLKKVQNDKVVFLTKSELEAVTKMKAETDQERIHRDFYVFMSNTGLRYVDALRVRKHHLEVVDGTLMIKIIQDKTTKPVQIPVTSDALRVLKEYNYDFSFSEDRGTGVKYTAQVGYYLNRMMKREGIADYPFIRTHFKNNTAIEEKGKMKRELILSHTARKTFINVSLKSGMDITAIKKIVGHSELNMILDVYGAGTINAEEMGNSGWVMPSVTELPDVAPMKVVA